MNSTDQEHPDSSSPESTEQQTCLPGRLIFAGIMVFCIDVASGGKGLWLLFQPIVIAFFVLIAIVVIYRVIASYRRHTCWRFDPLGGAIAVLFFMFLSYILFSSVRTTFDDIRSTQEHAGFSYLFRNYIAAEGKMPESLAELEDKGYLIRESSGRWYFINKQSRKGNFIRDAAWYDFAWGTPCDMINEAGEVQGMNRSVVQPASGIDALGVKSISRILSSDIGDYCLDYHSEQNDAK